MFTHCFSLCSCQRTVGQKTLLLSETLILSLEAGQRVFHGKDITANRADLSSIPILIYKNETRHNLNRQNLKVQHRMVENSGFEPLTSTLQK